MIESIENKKTVKKPSGMATNFAFQAAVLAGAGIISRIIGVLYRSPLFQIIGDTGNGYYGTAYNIYAMILMISTYSIPTAVSKIISGKLALGEYRNARRIFYCSFIYVIIAGGIAAVLTYAFAPQLVHAQPNAALCLRILAPAIFLSGFLAIFRGYLQAYNTMVPTSISQILEQLMHAVVSITAAYILTRPFVFGTAEHAKYGAAGSAMGIGAGVLAGTLFMMMAYAGRRKQINAAIIQDKTAVTDTYAKIFQHIFAIMTPIIIAAVAYNVTPVIDANVFYNILQGKGMSELDSVDLYGMYSGQYVVLINLPVAIASAVGVTLIPNISGAYVKGDMKAANHVLNESMSLTMMVTIPCAVGMGVLAGPILQMLFPGADPMVEKALLVGCVSVVFYSISTLTNSVLQGIGKVMEPVKNAILALLIHLVILILVLKFTHFNLYALVVGAVAYSFMMCVLNAFSVKKYLSAKIDGKRVYFAPVVASLLMGAVAWGSYRAIYMIVHSNVISLVLSIVLSMLFYGIAMIKIGGYSKEELSKLPKGTLIVRFAEKLHLM